MFKFLNEPMYPETYEWSFIESLLVSLVAIAFVFLILLIIVLCISAMQKLFFSNKTKKEPAAPVKKTVAPVAKKEVKNTEIKDEDMMVAALIATIDYANETKKDVRLVSIKQIG